jgi:hypothetical protein
MAEWSKRGTVNTFYRGSNPLKAYTKKKIKLKETLSTRVACEASPLFRRGVKIKKIFIAKYDLLRYI